ncbi:MAG: DciA family protein, partial [Alphaproteobacteria bacterium]
MAEGQSAAVRRLLATPLMRREASAAMRTAPAWRPPPAVGARLRPVAARLYQAKAPGHAGLMLHWPEIVGPELAAVTEPGKLKEGSGLVNN